MFGTYACARNVLTDTWLSLNKDTRAIIVPERGQKPVIKRSIPLAQKYAPLGVLKGPQRVPDGIVCHGEDAMRCRFGILASSDIQACLSRGVRTQPFVPKRALWVVLIHPRLNKYHRNLPSKSEGNTNLHLAFHATSLQYLRYLIVFNKLPQV